METRECAHGPKCWGAGPDCYPAQPPDADGCDCFWTHPSTWLSAASLGYGSGYEPGSQREWNPDCPVHGIDAAIVAAFPWPCDRREAHGPHREQWVEPAHGCDGSERSCQENCPVPQQFVLDCPGVSAHPLTQIGRPS